MGRAPSCDERLGLKKGPWTPEEDQRLVAYVQEHGHGNWRALPEKAGLARCGKSCRLRWTNYLRPDIKRGRFSPEEEQTIIQLHSILGNRWSAIASHLPRRTDNEIKNYWNTHLKKRLTQLGIDPVTHKTSAAGLALSAHWTPLASTRLSHMSQWEIALAEAQARLSSSPWNQTPFAAPPAPHPSSYFMGSWKTNPTTSIAPRHSRDSHTLLGLPRDTESTPCPTATVTIASPLASKLDHAFPDYQATPKGAAMLALPRSRCTVLSYNYGDVTAENAYNASPENNVAIENLFSPTSILHGPDSESCGSGGTNSDCLVTTFLRHSSGYLSSGFQQGFHFVEQEEQEEAQDIPETFWQAAAGSSLLAASSEAALELMGPLDFATSDGDHEFATLESLCQTVQ